MDLDKRTDTDRLGIGVEVEEVRTKSDLITDNKYKAALFDMDGTLIDSMGIWHSAPQRVLEKMNVTAGDEVADVFRELGYNGCAKYLVKEYGLPLSPEEIMKEMDQVVYEAYKDQVSLKYGAYDYLKSLKKKGVRCGIVTANNIEFVNLVVERFKMEPLVDACITIHEVGKSKRSPDVFLRAAEKLRVTPEECVMYEDSAYAVITAKKIGMMTVGIEDEYGVDQKEILMKECGRFVHGFEELLAEDVFE